MPMNFTRTALLLAAMMGIFVLMGAVLGGQGGMVVAFIVALAMNLFALWKSDKMILRMHGAQEVDAQSGGEFYGIVRALSERAELPMPRVFIMQNPQPNALATGRNPQNAAIAASTGLIEMLSAEEVAGVMAHELAHIKSRDTLTMTVAASLGGAISMMAQYLQFGAIFGSRQSQRLGWIGFMITALLAPLAAMLVQTAISRSREFQADRLGAMICGQPRWLSSALVKIHNQVQRIRNRTAEMHPASAHMFIVNPLTGSGLASLFSTHPPIEDRVAELEKLAVEMERVRRDQGGAVAMSEAPWLRRTSSPRGPWG